MDGINMNPVQGVETKKRKHLSPERVAEPTKSYRVYIDGVFDLFHFGHARALKQAKELFPQTYLLVGVCNDEITAKHKGKTVMSQEERVESLIHCRYVDEVIPNAPWFVDGDFISKYKIDFVVHGYGGTENKSDEYYKAVRDLGKFISIKRTEGISTSLLILRILKDYDQYVTRCLKKGVPSHEVRVSLPNSLPSRNKKLRIERHEGRKNIARSFSMEETLQLTRRNVEKTLEKTRKNMQKTFGILNWNNLFSNTLMGDFIKRFGDGIFQQRAKVLGFMKKIGIWRIQHLKSKAKQNTSLGHIFPLSSDTTPTSPRPASDQEEESIDPVFKTKAFGLCKQYVERWSDMSEDEFHVSVVKGGLTNLLFKCSRVSTSKDKDKDKDTDKDKDKVQIKTPLISIEREERENQMLVWKKSDEDHHYQPKLSTDSDSDSSKTGPAHVLLRIYGADTDKYFDREKENLIFQHFSDWKFGPHLYGVFAEGRLEEFIMARTLNTSDLDKFKVQIAVNVAFMHSFPMPFDNTPSLFDTLNNWYGLAVNMSSSIAPSRQEMMKKIDLVKVGHELSYLQDLLLSTPSPVVFCHNDLQEGNILCNEQEKIKFIDFEYGNYNFRGYDFGNHFNEWIYDYTLPEFPHFVAKTENYPSKEKQKEFFYHYLVAWKRLQRGSAAAEREEGEGNGNGNGNGKVKGKQERRSRPRSRSRSLTRPRTPPLKDRLGQKKVNKRWSEGEHMYENDDEDDEEDGDEEEDEEDEEEDVIVEEWELENMYVETSRYSLASHLLWCLWGVIQSSSSDINFGYLEYSDQRLRDYFIMKQSFISLKFFPTPSSSPSPPPPPPPPSSSSSSSSSSFSSFFT